MNGVILVLVFFRIDVRFLLSLWLILMLEFLILVFILFNCCLSFVYFNFCIWSVSLIFLGGVWDIGELMWVGFDNFFSFDFFVLFDV